MNHNKYQSPYSNRYGDEEVQRIWGENNKRILWRNIWVILAKAQARLGLIPDWAILELESKEYFVDVDLATIIESSIKHDLMAELKVFASQCPKAGGYLHLGATSSDIEDNADIIRIKYSLDYIINMLDELLKILADNISKYSDLVVMAYTHLQPAEPTTLAYRMACWSQDLLEDRKRLILEYESLRGKGFKGAVGTSASYTDLLGVFNTKIMENNISEMLDVKFFEVSTQVYPRKQDHFIVSAISSIGATIHKIALDLRLMQSPLSGELSESFGVNQVGSSTMPFKRNPISSEKVDSIARSMSVLPQITWHNAAQSMLERTLDDSASRRSVLPEAFISCSEILSIITKVLSGLVVNTENINANMKKYGPFASIERVLMSAVKNGGDRQKLHEQLRIYSMIAWKNILNGEDSHLREIVMSDPIFSNVDTKSWDYMDYIGNVKYKSLKIADLIRAIIGDTK